MALYRAKPADGAAWVTGASSGIGRELALRLATQGYTVAATARRADDLAKLAAELVTGTGRIVAFPCDVADRAAMADAADAIERSLGPVSLAVFNAGVYLPLEGGDIDLDEVEKTFQLNVLGTLYGAVPMIARMKRRGRGQIVLVGSTSSYMGLPAASAYGASKAALNYLAESLKHDLDGLNIRIQVVNPGFVDTPATKKNEFKMPALISAESAAVRMADGISGGGFEIHFPRRFTLILKLIRLLPIPLRFWLVHKATDWDNHKAKA